MKNRFLNRAGLWADLVIEAKLTVSVLAVLISLISFLVCWAVSNEIKYNYISVRSQQMKLQGRYFYQLGFRTETDYSDNEELIRELLSKKSIQDVTCLNYFSGTGADVVEGEWRSLFLIYNLSDSHEDKGKILSVPGLDGQVISYLSPNHVLLDESANGEYSIGDHFNLRIEYISTYPNTHVEEADIDVTVDGFVRREESIIYTGHQLTDLSRVFTTVYDPTHPIENAVIGGYPSYYCICSVLEYEGKSINFNETLPQMLVITPRDGADLDDLYQDLSECGLNPQELRSYEQLFDEYTAVNAQNRRLALIFLFSATGTAACVVFGIMLSWYTFHRREIAIYTLCGGSLKSSIMLSASPYYFSIITGGLVGVLAWILYERFIKVEATSITGLMPVLLIVIYIVFYSAALLVYYLFYRRISPVDLYRIKE